MSPKKWKRVNATQRKLSRPANPAGSRFLRDRRSFLQRLLTTGRQHKKVLPAFLFTRPLLATYLVAVFTGSVVAQHNNDTPSDNLRKSIVEVFTFEQPPSDDQPAISLNPLASGFGIVIRTDGKILTARHLIGDPESCHIRVRFDDSDELVPAKLLAADSWVDLAILTIARTGLSHVSIAETGAPAGERVMIYPANRISESITGIAEQFPVDQVEDRDSRLDCLASDSHYQYGGLMRIRASRTGFRSGAAIINPQGELVGMTTALVPDSNDGPDFVAVPLYPHIVSKMLSGVLHEYAFLGVRPRDLSTSQLELVPHGIQIVDVVTHSPADVLGLQFSDVITHVNQVPISSTNEFWSIVSRLTAQSEINIRGIRGALSGSEPEQFERSGLLDKRLLQTRRSSWQSVPPRQWRGLQVEHPFAVPRYQALIHSIRFRECVVALNVEIDSLAWNAGLRPGFVITRIDGETIQSPDHFDQVVNKAGRQSVVLTVTDSATGEPVRFTIPPE